jgi:hypothetical protein
LRVAWCGRETVRVADRASCPGASDECLEDEVNDLAISGHRPTYGSPAVPVGS